VLDELDSCKATKEEYEHELNAIKEDLVNIKIYAWAKRWLHCNDLFVVTSYEQKATQRHIALSNVYSNLVNWFVSL